MRSSFAPLRATFFSLALVSLAALTSPAAYAQTVFSNTTAISIPTQGLANPYPSSINVTGLTGTISNITVTLTGFSHTFPDDIAILFTGPGNTNPVILTDGPGDGTSATNLTWTFSDSAAATLPTGGSLVSGTFRPGQNQYNDVLPAPAPTGTYATNFSGFIGKNPNGLYNLYIADYVAGDGGSISGGWSVSITTVTAAVSPEPGTLALIGLGAVPLLSMVAQRRKSKSA